MAKKKISCRPTFRISQAGHLLKTKGTSKSGSVLSKEGKEEKRKLPKNLQKAILAHQRSLGKRIIN